jgi:transposase InsO family protein
LEFGQKWLKLNQTKLPQPTAAQCKVCIVAKQHVQPFPKNSHTEIKEIRDLTVSDLWGPARTQAPGGDRYFVTFTDGKSRRTMTYFMRQKSEALAKFKQYKSFVETQTSHKLKKLRVDGGGEFLSKEFRKYLLDNGIQLDITTPHSPSQNGIAEQLNQTLVEHGQAMIHQHDLPYSLWKEAVAYATYLKNRSPTRAIRIKRYLMKSSGERSRTCRTWRNSAKHAGFCSRMGKTPNSIQNQGSLFLWV